MTDPLYPLLLLLHLLAAAAWVGGMFFAHFALRPAAAEVLEPPQRIRLMAAALGRFFRLTVVSVVVILATGLVLLLRVGMAQAPLGWHVMLTLGLVMAMVFAYIALALNPRLQAHAAAGAWPQAAQVLQAIRRLVSLNLLLGACAIAAAVSARA